MDKADYEKAHKDFRLDRKAEEIEKFYHEIIKLGRWRN